MVFFNLFIAIFDLCINEVGDKMTIHDKLRNLRKLKGLTQENVATYVKLSRGSISKYETGKTQNISSDMIRKFAEYYDVPLSYFQEQTTEETAPYDESFLSQIDEREKAAILSLAFKNDHFKKALLKLGHFSDRHLPAAMEKIAREIDFLEKVLK